MIGLFCLITLLGFVHVLPSTQADGRAESEERNTFSNPILPNGADPWVLYKEGTYYYTQTNGRNVELWATDRMEELSSSRAVVIWQPEKGQEFSRQIWAPELHFLDGKWYLYVAATYDSGKEKSLNENRRMFVLENASPSPMNQDWVMRGKIADTSDLWAIDGTVLEVKEERYFIWSGWRTADHESNTGRQQLYIARMVNPWTLEGERVMISEPTYGWEKHGLVNEGPVVLKNNEGGVFLVYSASGCWTDEYKLGVLTFDRSGDPLDPAAWVKHPEPVFTKSIENGVYAPGHNGFFKSPDGTEDWILYHANDNPGDGCGGKRSPRVQRFSWNEEGFPVFGEPEAITRKIEVPSSVKD